MLPSFIRSASATPAAVTGFPEGMYAPGYSTPVSVWTVAFSTDMSELTLGLLIESPRRSTSRSYGSA